MIEPSWFSALTWSSPILVEDLRTQRYLIPESSGVYAFTRSPGRLEKNLGVLYVGKAKSLRNRLPSYLGDPADIKLLSQRSATPRMNTSLRHAGKVQLLVEIQQHEREGHSSTVWVRWHTSTRHHTVETALIQYLNPAFNSQGLPADGGA